jgi:hypothetical protein
MSESRQIMQGNGQGLVEFFERAAERGDLNKSSALATRSTARKVLAVESDDLDSVDLRVLDIDDLLERFVRLHKADYGDASLETYRSRFRLGVAMYLAWLDDNPNWKAAGRAAPPPRRPASPGAGPARPAGRKPKEPKGMPELHDDPSPAEAALASATASRVMTYDVPLREDLIVRLTLPIDLTTVDAARLSNFVNALAFSGTAVPESHPDEGGS